MSDSVRSLLVRGIAAAKAEEPDEARFFLEWVLREQDASDEQKVNAWLWLSQLKPDPADRRDCLENALALDPSNALARRGLAFLNHSVSSADVVDPFDKPQPVTTPAALTASQVRRYVCPQCGGRMSFAADKRKLTCASCGHQTWEYKAIQDGALVREQDFAAALPTAKAHRWELPAERTLECQGCGATVALAPAHVTGTCPFCNSAYSAHTSPSRELVAPEGVLPFQFDASAARKHVGAWLGKQRFRPSDLDDEATIATLCGVYLPFWTFDLSGEIKWRGWVWEGSGRNGRWVPRDGAYLVYHNDMLIPATHSLPVDLLGRLTDYDMNALVPYSTDAIADWSTEIYQVTMSDASLVARRRALEAGIRHIQNRTLGSENTKDVTFNSSGVTIDSFKLVLLPVWVSGYRYKRQSFSLAVNGQTGKVVGDVPRNGFRKLLAGIFGGL